MNRKKRKIDNTSKLKIEIALDLRNCAKKYSGLEVSKRDLSGSRKKEICGTITISGWHRPENGEELM
jgi:hypothetical protein